MKTPEKGEMTQGEKGTEMSMKHKMIGVVCAGALALGGVVPAFAANDTGKTVNADKGTAEVEISAAVAKQGENIVSVTLPSKMAIGIKTKTDGTFDSTTGTSATVSNNDVSTADVKVEITKVTQNAGVDSNGKLLDLVDLKLFGDDTTNGIKLQEGDQTNKILFSRISNGGSASLKLDASAATSNPVIPTDAYTVSTILKVTAL